MKDFDAVLERSDILHSSGNTKDRERIRAVMNGGGLGVHAVLNWYDGQPYQGSGSGAGPDSLGVDLPTANIMYSGLERLAQKLGRAPTIKTDMIPTKDTNKNRERAEKRARIVRGWDDTTRMELQYPQIGRWLPGYGFTFHTIRERKIGGQTIPVAELRDPYDVFPGFWGPDQQPSEVAIYRQVSRKELKRAYPEYGEVMDKRWSTTNKAVPILGTGDRSWEGNPHHPVTLIEYYDHDGTHIICPELGAKLGFIPNPLESGPAFVMAKRFSFDQLQSHFHHVFGLMAMMAKMNLLGLIAAEDANFRETNIVGELIGDTYERGRFAVNQFEPGTRIEKPTGEQIQQTFQAINILERQFRTVAGYDVAQDGQSPNSFATGQGIRELGSSFSESIREYQTTMKHAIECIDMKRLEWDDTMHARTRKKVYWYEGSSAQEETYRPDKDIAGDYRTERIYGAMSTFDDSQQIISGLQLLQARIIDRRTMQENVDGLHNVDLVNERIDQDMAKEQLMQALGGLAANQDPRAQMALVEIMANPGKTEETLKKLFTPEEPQLSPEEEAMIAAQGGGMGGEMGPPPAVQTILSQLESPGGGVQTVGQLA